MSKWWAGVVRSWMTISFSAIVIACSSSAKPRASAVTTSEQDEGQQLITFVPLDIKDRGLSDLTLDAQRYAWAVTERERKVYRLSLDSPPPIKPDRAYAVLDGSGKPLQGFDLEGIAVLDDYAQSFALSAEEQEGTRSRIFFANLTDGELKVDERETIEITTEHMGLTPQEGNLGAEGICGQGDTVIVAIEATSSLRDGRRWAPVIRYKNRKKEQLYRVWLTSNKGTISALSCSIDCKGNAEVLAIEKSKQARKVIFFSLAPSSENSESSSRLKEREALLHKASTDAVDIVPWEHDLAFTLSKHCPTKENCSPNLEGLFQTEDGRLAMISDNSEEKYFKTNNVLIFNLPFSRHLTRSRTARPERAVASGCN